jgi:hypothetical protein
MRFGINRFTLLLSLQDAGSIGAPAGGGESAAPPSAPAPSAAPPSAAPVPVPSSTPSADPLAGYEYTGLGDLARQLAEGPPPAPEAEQAPTLTATPEGQPPAEAAPTGEPVPVPLEGEQAPPAAPAPVEQFQALKTELETQKQAVTAKEQELATAQGRIAEFEAYAPAVEIMRANPGLVELVNMLQPVVSAGLSGFEDPRAGDIGAEFIKQLDLYDQRVSSALINGTLRHYGADIEKRALARIGIAEQDIPDYQRWKASGGAVSPAFTLDQFPVADAEGIALIPITDPVTKQVSYESVDVNDANGLYKYNTEKWKFEQAKEETARKEAERTATATRQAQEERTRQEAAAREQQQNITTWLSERGQAETAAYEKLNPAFTGEFERFSKAAASMAHTEMWNDPDYQRLLKDGREAARNGEGRRAAIGADLDKLAEKHLASAVTFYSDIVARLTAAEAATQEGKPKLPADAPRIGAETRLIQSAPPAPTPRPAAGSDGYLYNGAEAKPERRPGEDYATFIKRVNGGSLGSRMVATTR